MLTDKIIDKLNTSHCLKADELSVLLSERDQYADTLFKLAQETAQKSFGNKVFIRGLIEFTNYCRNNCYYCGIRAGNANAVRYRLSKEEILNCCQTGYELEFRTFVLQGGEDMHYSPSAMADIVYAIKTAYPSCAVTLSVGEHSRETYALWKSAGADRYLLRHETANPEHYAKLHPESLSLANRKQCLCNLKELGYQVGSGFMVGSPFQTIDNIVEDLMFLQELRPQMIGIGPFIPHSATPFANYPAGDVKLTLVLISILRLLFPDVLLPATTALGTLAENGRLLGIKAGANVIMPNLSPNDVRKNYLLYDNKLCSGAEAAESLNLLRRELQSIGYDIAIDRGDYEEKEWIHATTES